MKVLIAILALISIIAFKIYQITRVPKELKNVPTLSFLDLFITKFLNCGPDKRWEDTRDTFEKEGITVFYFYHLKEKLKKKF